MPPWGIYNLAKRDGITIMMPFTLKTFQFCFDLYQSAWLTIVGWIRLKWLNSGQGGSSTSQTAPSPSEINNKRLLYWYKMWCGEHWALSRQQNLFNCLVRNILRASATNLSLKNAGPNKCSVSGPHDFKKLFTSRTSPPVKEIDRPIRIVSSCHHRLPLAPWVNRRSSYPFHSPTSSSSRSSCSRRLRQKTTPPAIPRNRKIDAMSAFSWFIF